MKPLSCEKILIYTALTKKIFFNRLLFNEKDYYLQRFSLGKRKILNQKLIENI